ncbi:MAG: hypothetical protein HOE48_00415 [Candidatus Latescibacteria bacterium]|jgi:hypothetical protein|nr:hypothetical protein [Candidatus Latescibacterota bacterium]MBT4136340.1 hypothetical protein [Candidatus Latescibacterota bacterium]MBT5828664.1 hypothetical protein [Candidatus Latescibacterota bacterium]
MEWFNITWIFGIITLACAGFFLQMVVAYNVVRGQIIPALNQVREIRKRHGVEIEKVDRLTKEAETQLAELEVEAQGLGEQIKDLDEKLEAYKDDDSEER